MSRKMKILIAYDGSECAHAALRELTRAGLPEEAEATVISVADAYLPHPSEDEAVFTAQPPFPAFVIEGVKLARLRALAEVKQAYSLALLACEQVRQLFPAWQVRPEACADSPAWGIIKKASVWEADLIVVGTHGHSLLNKYLLGSVSQKVLYEAPCSVRIARENDKAIEAPLRIMIGTDGTPGADAAIKAVAARNWPAGTEARVIAVLDTMMYVGETVAQHPVVKWLDANNQADCQWMQSRLEESAEKLRAVGITATVTILSGNPKSQLIAEAESWQADTIFVGARGIRGLERFLLGSTSAAVAGRASCSVEVVRVPKLVETVE